jgi:UDPglucose 6-dehydrogenase
VSSVQCLKDADCCIIVTEWEEFQKLTPEDFINKMRNPVVIDGRKIYNPKLFLQNKINYSAIGLGK